MNIGIVTTWFERGAAYVSKQFEEIISQKHNVYIYARGGDSFAKGNPKWDTPNVYWTKLRFQAAYINQKEFKTWIKNKGIDIVFFNEQKTFAPILWCKDLGVKTIAYIDYYKENSIPLFNLYDAIICNTQRHYSAFENHPHRYYVPWGTDTNLYKPVNADGKLVEEGKVVFFNSAGMNPLRKGTDTFIKALHKCKDDPQIKAIIHSQKNLRKFFPDLATTIDELVKCGRLEVIEKTISAPGLYYKADVYVYPSILDGIGLTVPEAISSGLACIASDNPPMNEFVHQEFGSLIKITRLYARSDGYYWPQCRCSVESLVNIMQDYASQPEKVVNMKQKAREYALQNLSFKKNAESIFELLEKVKFIEADSELCNKVDEIDKTYINKLRSFKFNIEYRIPLLDKILDKIKISI